MEKFKTQEKFFKKNTLGKAIRLKNLQKHHEGKDYVCVYKVYNTYQ